MRPIFINCPMLIASIAEALYEIDEDSLIGFEVYGMKTWTKLLLPNDFVTAVKNDNLTSNRMKKILDPLEKQKKTTSRLLCSAFF